MASWQALLIDRYIRLVIRRRDWGDEAALARRARRLFGAPRVLQRRALRGLMHERVSTASGVCGEWLSSSSSPRGVLLYVHGGGFVSCSAATHRPVAASLAHLTEARVFSADYRTAPEARFPAALDDVIAVYQWLFTEGAPGTPIAIAGESAGGGLVFSLAQQARDARWPAPACVVALSPAVDLTGASSSPRNAGRCAMFHPRNLSGFASAYLGSAPADDPRASPLCGDLRGLPPVLLQLSSTELPFEQGRRLHERIVAAGGASRLTVYEDLPHAWQLLTPFVPEARTALQEIADFVRAHLGRPRDAHASGEE